MEHVADIHARADDLIGLQLHEVWQALGRQGVSRSRWTYELPGQSWTQSMDVLFDDQDLLLAVLTRTDS